MDVVDLVDRDLAQPRIDRLALPREAPDLLDRGRERVAQDLLGGRGIAEARQDHRAVERLCVAFEDRSHGVEVAGLGLLDLALLFFELDRVWLVRRPRTPPSTRVAAASYTRAGTRRAVVADLDQLEALRRRGDAGLRAVLRRKDLGHLADGPPARPDLGQRSDEDPHHVAQERVSADIDLEQVAGSGA